MTRWLLLIVLLCVACGDDDTPNIDAGAGDAQTDAPESISDAALDADRSDAEPAALDGGLDASDAEVMVDAQVDVTDAQTDASDGSVGEEDASDAQAVTCEPGFALMGTACADIDECLTDNGGCDSAAVCSNSDGAFSCGECATGYVGDAINGCIPRLASLSVNEAAIDPLFDRDQQTYAAQVGLHDDTIRVDASAAPDGASIAINDVAVVDGHALVALDVGDNVLNVTVEGSNGRVHTYVLTVNRAPTVLRHAYIKASNANGADLFSRAVALSGDTLVVGAPGEDSNATGVNGNQGNPFNNTHLGSGAAYVFVRDGNSWTQQAYLKASNTRASDAFGTSVAIDGDALVVGAPNQDGVGQPGAQITGDGGAVYVFTRSAGVWTQQAFVQPAVVGAGDHFGSSVSVDGDTLVVGAPHEDSAGQGVDPDATNNIDVDSGAAYVFTRVGSTWSQQAYLKAARGDAGDGFGTSLVVDGDVLAIGAPNEASSGVGVEPEEDNGASGSGAVYVFTRDQGPWAQTAWLKASNLDAGDHFGTALALDSNRLAVGAPNEGSATGAPEDNSAVSCGAVYVFVRENDTWSAPAYVKSAVVEAEDQFGASVAFDGELLLVGMPGEDGSGSGVNPEAPVGPESNGSAQSGAVHVFAHGSTWLPITYLKPFVAEYAILNFAFGTSVAASGGNLAVGAIGDSSLDTGINPPMPAPFTAPDTGGVFMFR